jgi:NAD(P)H-hydrate epimerase
MLTLTRDQARDIDRRALVDYGLAGVVLMENAGRGVATLLRTLGATGPVVICCGKGNNGGDGLVIARHLDNHGIPVRVVLFGPPDQLSADAAANYPAVVKGGIPLTLLTDATLAADKVRQQLTDAAWIVDALFGTGLTGPLRSPFDTVVNAINASGARVLAVDLPSGLDTDTGEPLGPTVRAHHTATFVAPKHGFANASAQPWLGQVHVIDIGVPRILVDAIARVSTGTLNSGGHR